MPQNLSQQEAELDQAPPTPFRGATKEMTSDSYVSRQDPGEPTPL